MTKLQLLHKLCRLSAGRAIAYSYGLDVIFLYHLLYLTGGHRCFVYRRMRENGLVVQQVALSVEAHHLAASAKARVDAHHTFLAQRSRQQQLAQVFGKHAYGLVVGFLLAHIGKLGFYRGLQQALIGIFYGLAHQCLAGPEAMHKLALQLVEAYLIVGRDRDAQDALVLATTHGQQAVRRATTKRL